MSTDRPTKGLGMGLSALIGDARPAPSDEQAASRGGVREIEIGRIRPNPNQPRIQFSDELIDELADLIAERGVLQPILLRPHGDGEDLRSSPASVAGAQRSGRGCTPSRRSYARSMRRQPPSWR